MMTTSSMNMSTKWWAGFLVPQKAIFSLHYLKTESLLFFFVAFSLSPCLNLASPLSFDIENFVQGAENILYEGLAAPHGGFIELINDTDAQFGTGRASYAFPVQLYDKSTGTAADFNLSFSFTINSVYDDPTRLSDGFVFFFAPMDYSVPPNSGGGKFGMVNSTTFKSQLILVEFDNHANPVFGDPQKSHVGIDANGSFSSVALQKWDAETTLGNVTHVLITFDGKTGNLSVSWTYEQGSGFAGNRVSHYIDVMNELPERVRIGFSSATGMNSQRTTIRSWKFSSNLTVPSRKQPTRSIILIVIGVVAFTILMVGLFVGRFVVKKRAEKIGRSASIEADIGREALPRRFSYQELAVATNKFADNMRLGQGGSGFVYKGMLFDLGRLVAVKRILTESLNSERIFVNEVKIISRLVHRNLVQFIGWCHQKNEFLLVYEYMPNGSLDTHLFGNKKSLLWHTRYKIALGLASAIQYLHEDVEQCVLHRDIKAANVLLDTDFHTKLGDFGASKLVDSRLRTQMTGLVGTFGYLAPEYVNEGRVSKKSDIFSFGVVALEIACGRRTYQDGGFHVPLSKWVWTLYKTGSILDAADERLNMDFDAEEMERLLMVGLWCTNPKDNARPKAGQVTKVLQLELPIPKLSSDMHNLMLPPISIPSFSVDSSL
ncbi:hypothetical protein Tsubulata_037413 [Turnera subulata]|uniref:Protein kinase domain-containing protein n=1 Tax=Turnera subulata TaxID=218843 RepID=A0A9Q0J173_9ROSI|nr:hypothetical protein Tsubulata_037413 [Turnera subulata]